MRSMRLIGAFMRASLQEEAAYRANFWLSLFYSLLNLATGALGVWIVFSQVQSVNGWSLDATLALLGVYLTVSALRSLFIGPGLEALAGMDGEIWSGRLDFTLLRPVNLQFLVSLRKWRWFSLLDVALGVAVTVFAGARLGAAITWGTALAFILTLAAGLLVLYAFLLAFAGLVFWSPGVLFTWVFDGLFQMGRFPVGMYPGWLRLALTWVIPIGLMTTLPAQALIGAAAPGSIAAGVLLAVGLTLAASALFWAGARRYASASS